MDDNVRNPKSKTEAEHQVATIGSGYIKHLYKSKEIVLPYW
jgi:hypothetical protein